MKFCYCGHAQRVHNKFEADPYYHRYSYVIYTECRISLCKCKMFKRSQLK